MDLQRLASTLLGKRRAETNNVMTDATTRTYVGTATSASEDGSVYVALSQDVTLSDDDDGEHGLGVEMPTTVAVDEGDEVLVTVFGGGVMKAPVVTGNPGWGDKVQAQVDNAETLAQQAEAVATATGQHFWTGDDGVHVTEVTQDEWSDSAGTSYHSGMNVLINALGQLFRDGLDNILAILSGTTPGLAIYDGTGNTADHILAEFMADHVRVGGNVPDGTGVESAVQFFDQTETHDTDLTASTYFDGDGSTYQTMQSTVNLSSALADEGKAIDTGSSGTAALDLVNMLENGISDVGEQHNEVTAALVADASYSDGAATSHAAVRATASTTGGSGLSYAELIADALGIGTNEGAIDYTTMAQVLAAIRRPTATYTGSSSTTTDSASGWKLTWFNVALATNGPVGDYFTNSNGVITAVRDCKLLISCAMRWQDSTAGQRGIGLFTGVNGGDSGGTEACSTFEYFDQTNSSNRAVYLPPRLFALSAGDHITVRRNTQNNAVYTNGPGMSWLTVEVVG